MRNAIRHLIPSMFQRRLWLLLAVVFLVVAGMGYRIAQLTLVQGSELREEAESALSENKFIRTVRGRILDRKGRVLALDRPSYDVSVMYNVITGQWAYQCATRDAKKANRPRWPELGYEEREKLIAEAQRPYNDQLEVLWRTLCEIGKIDRKELERRKDDIKIKVQQISSSLNLRLWERENEKRRAEFEEPITMGEVATEVEEQRSSHNLLSDLGNDAVLRVQRLIAAGEHDEGMEVWDRVSIEPSKERDYPLETMPVTLDRSTLPSPLRSDEPYSADVQGVGMHIIGLMRGIYKEDVATRPFIREMRGSKAEIDLRGYMLGDQAGSWGVEKSQEEMLRGARGREVHFLDSDKTERTEPLPGGDVALTIDASLQARVQAIMDPGYQVTRVQIWHGGDPTTGEDDMRPEIGDALNGAAVVLDIATGQVIASVSTPSLKLSDLRDNPAAVWNDEANQPFVNRVVARAYQPGSTVKPLVLTGAVTDHKIGYNDTINCTGHYYANNPNVFRCWIFKTYHKTHEYLTGPEALEQSCNIFFNTLGDRLGVEGLTHWYGAYGLGRKTGCGLAEEVSGSLPDPARVTQDERENTAINMGIGQGPILWTPIQAAAAYAAVARGGTSLAPTYVLSPERADEAKTDLHLDPRAAAEAMDGLYRVVHSQKGTANHLSKLGNEPIFNVPGVKVIGKSGTAQAAKLRIDSDKDRRITSRDKIVREGNHAWCIVIVQKEGATAPQYVVAAVLEYGGSGGNVAGPVVNQILHAMKQEGYL